MKSLKYFIILACTLAVGVTSCSEWLDVNTDPDRPNNESALVENRMPWLQHFLLYSAGVTNYRASACAGYVYSTAAGPNAWAVTQSLDGAAGSSVTSYQTFFIESSSNIVDLYNKAKKEGAYHYMAAANVFHAMGFMQMLDLFGEMPYTEALANIPAPKHDDGKTIFEGCIAKLDEAIELFGKVQESGATHLSRGDMWNQGDVNKWIKLCYGLKARYLIKLSKKAEFNPQLILDCIAKGPQSINDNIRLICYNKNGDVTDYLLGDPIMTNHNWNYVAYGSTQRVSQYHYNLLTNMRGSGVVDPRMPKIVPATMSKVKLGADNRVQSFEWLRSKPVDFHGPSTRLVAGGAASIQTATYAATNQKVIYTIANDAARAEFIAAQEGKHVYEVNGNVVTVTYAPGRLYCTSTNYIYAGDTAYVNLRQCATLTGNAGNQGEMDMNWYYSLDARNAGVVGSTGSFQLRPNSDFDVLTYHEMCFIKAEVNLRMGNAAGALAAYKDGIKAHFDRMQAQLNNWKTAGYTNPDMQPMSSTDIDAYMSSAAVCQNAGDLKMSDIMLQKYIAMGCSVEIWNDMRRFNYSAGNVGSFGVVYPGFDRGPLFAGQAFLLGSSKTDPSYWIRRWRQPSLEVTYNETAILSMNPKALEPSIPGMPVWWDCATDQEYYGYLGKK